MRSFIAASVAAIASAALMDNLEFEFIQFVAKYNKQYVTYEEYLSRFVKFKIANAEIVKLNSENSSSVHAHNYTSDWTR
jgi:hypothetical protein